MGRIETVRIDKAMEIIGDAISEKMVALGYGTPESRITGARVKRAVASRLGRPRMETNLRRPRGAAVEARLAAELAFGSSGFEDTDDERTRQRNAMRAALLIKATLGSRPLSELRKKYRSKSTKELYEIIFSTFESFRRSHPELARAGRFSWADECGRNLHLAGSMDPLSSEDRNRALVTLTTAGILLSQAQRNVVDIRHPAALARYERWFGPLDRARYSEVWYNITKVRNYLCREQVVVHYRGASAVGTSCDSDWERKSLYTSGIITESHDDLVMVHPQEPMSEAAHLYLGDAFFSEAIRASGSCAAGGLIHELIQSVCDVKNVPNPPSCTCAVNAVPGKCPGHPGCDGRDSWRACHEAQGDVDHCDDKLVCLELAARRPVHSVHNASNYEFFCETFWEEMG